MPYPTAVPIMVRVQISLNQSHSSTNTQAQYPPVSDVKGSQDAAQGKAHANGLNKLNQTRCVQLLKAEIQPPSSIVSNGTP